MDPLYVLGWVTVAERSIAVGRKAHAFLRSILGKAGKDIPAQPLAVEQSPARRPMRTVAAIRSGNLVAVVAEAADEVHARGVRPRAVPLASLLPLLEAASLVENRRLRRMYARLLATAAAEGGVQPIYLRVLEQLSPEDAREFEGACALGDKFGVRFVPAGSHPVHRQLPQSPSHARLEALGLVVVWGSVTTREAGGALPGASIPVPALPSIFGDQFRRAVSAADAPNRPKPNSRRGSAGAAPGRRASRGRGRRPGHAGGDAATQGPRGPRRGPRPGAPPSGV